jgi:deoxyribose-phosphate aldolase
VSLESCTNAEGCTSCGHCTDKNPEGVNNIIALGASRISSKPGIQSSSDVAHLIDHTLLKPEATREQLKKLCEEAKTYSFATVCVNASNIPFVKKCLSGSSVKPIAVVGFPLGAMSIHAKSYEAKEAVAQGAQEIDMVINIGALKNKDYQMVLDDIRGVVNASNSMPVKVILETSALSDEEKVIACALSKAAGAAFVKTSTGFGKGGATVEDIALMRRVVGATMGVKASGGIKTLDDVKNMVKAGANRVGASASVAIVKNIRPQRGTAY